MGGIVGVARETMSATPSIVVPVRISARCSAPLGARVIRPVRASLKLHSPNCSVPAKEKTDKYRYVPSKEKTDKYRHVPSKEKIDKYRHVPSKRKTDKYRPVPSKGKTDKYRHVPSKEKER